MAVELSKVVYTTSAVAQGGRAGHVRSVDGLIDVDLAQPGTTPEPHVNPETLFAAAFAACFQSALAFCAKAQGIDTSDSTVTANVSLGKTADGFGLAVSLDVEIPGVEAVKARELVELANQACPYSKATRGNIDVMLNVI